MHLFASFEVDNIDWTGCGAYEVAITTDMSEATVVTLRNKLSGASAVLLRPHEQRRWVRHRQVHAPLELEPTQCFHHHQDRD